jgi:hypothetical protein
MSKPALPSLTVAGRTLSLKGYKSVAWMSEETVCFTATVLLDGKIVGEASNEGHGGSTFVRFVSPLAESTAQEFAKAAKPADYGWGFVDTMRVEDLVDILVEKIDVQKQEEKIIKKIRTKAAKEMHWVKTTSVKAEYYSLKKPLASGHPAEKLAALVKAKPDFKAFVIDLTDAEILAHFVS